LNFRLLSTFSRRTLVVVSAAFVVTAAIQLIGQNVATSLLVLSRDGRRALPLTVNGSQEMVGLDDLAAIEAGSLSYGHRRQLEVALALATEPALLLLDEPTAGMSREEARQFMTLIGGLPPELTLMIVEHDMDVVFELASAISVLDAGRLIATGPPEQIRASAEVQEAYLGSGERMDQVFIG